MKRTRSLPPTKTVLTDTKRDSPKAGADIGKIVNLMSVDANNIVEIAFSVFAMYTG